MHSLLLVLLIRSILAQNIRDAHMTVTTEGYGFQPSNASVQLLATRSLSTFVECAQACLSTSGCRTFDHDRSASGRCRLYEADQTTGKNIPSASSSIVGSMSITSQQFTSFNRTPCSTHCNNHPYLSCDANDTCRCAAGAYWDGSVCRLQKLTGPSCIKNGECRSDLGLVCLQFFQCGRKCHRSRQSADDDCIVVYNVAHCFYFVV